jgi:hypothetical protein
MRGIDTNLYSKITFFEKMLFLEPCLSGAYEAIFAQTNFV